MQIVANGAHVIDLRGLKLADETALAAGKFDIIEVDEFCFVARFFCAGFCRLKSLDGVPCLARRTVEKHYSYDSAIQSCVISAMICAADLISWMKLIACPTET